MDSRSELTSWKEIADFFQVSVRTVQHWEATKGLPVRRLRGGGRARVSANVAELEEWKRASYQLGHVEDADAAYPPLPRAAAAGKVFPFTRRTGTIAIAVAVILAVAAAVLTLTNWKGPPAGWIVENHSLIVFDAQQRELWRKVFSKPLDPGAYDRRLLDPARMPWLGDLDDDGKVEVLFPYQSTGASDPCVLFCFSAEGKERWHFTPGAEMRSQHDTYDPIYHIGAVAVIARKNSRTKGVLVISQHYRMEPTQVALLAADGKLLRQYWHSGHIGTGSGTLRIIDFDGDGKDEIYLCGVDNGYRQATLVVLDPESFEGAALEEDGQHQLQGFPAGREMKRILFPRSCMNRKMHDYNNAYLMDFTGKSLVVHVSEIIGSGSAHDVHLFYTFAPDFSLIRFETGDYFETAHAQMHKEGKLDHAFNPAELDAFRHLIYLTPRSLSPVPTAGKPQQPR